MSQTNLYTKQCECVHTKKFFLSIHLRIGFILRITMIRKSKIKDGSALLISSIAEQYYRSAIRYIEKRCERNKKRNLVRSGVQF